MSATQQAKTKAMANGAKSSRPMEKGKGMAKKMKGEKKKDKMDKKGAKKENPFKEMKKKK